MNKQINKVISMRVMQTQIKTKSKIYIYIYIYIYILGYFPL